MRREGYELQLGQPKVIIKEVDGQKLEPIEQLTIEVPENFSSRVIDLVQRRKGDMLSMETKDDRVFMEFAIPSRGIIGLTNPLLTSTEGEAIIAHRFKDFEPWRGDLIQERNGSLIALETGTAIPYAINNLQSRGKFFIDPGDEVYAGEIIGENTRQDDIIINVCKTKKLTNMRAAGSDDKVMIEPATKMSLEECMEYIKDDEYVEVTPKSIRLRKIILDETERKRANRENN
jgi:GTP-binding protein